MRLFAFVVLTLFFAGLGHASEQKKKMSDLELVKRSNKVVLSRYNRGQYARGLATAEKVWKSAVNLLGEKHLETLNSMHNYALLLQSVGRYDEAETVYHKVYALRREVLGIRHDDTISSINNIAYILQLRGKLQAAQAWYMKALGLRVKTRGQMHELTLVAYNNLAGIFQVSGQYERADSYYKLVYKRARKVHGDDHPFTLTVLNNIAGVYLATKKLALAEPLYVRLVKDTARVLGASHPETLSSLNGLAALYMAQKRFALAEPIVKQALGILEKRHGVRHLQTLGLLHRLASLYSGQGKFDLAELTFKRVLKAYETLLGDTHPLTLDVVGGLAMVQHALDRKDVAERLYLRIYQGYREVFGNEHPSTIHAISVLSSVYFQREDWAGSTELLDRAIEGIVRRSRLQGVKGGAGSNSTEGRVFGSLFQYYLISAYRLAERRSYQKRALGEKGFVHSQFIQDQEIARSLAKMSARVAGKKGTLARLVREQQDLMRSLHKLEGRFSQALSIPSKKQNEGLNLRIERLIARSRARLEEVNSYLETSYSDYANVIQPRALSVEETQRYLKRDEVLIYVVDTQGYLNVAEESFIWVVTKNDFKWLRSPLGARGLEKIVRRLRCGLDPVSLDGKVASQVCRELVKASSKSDLYKGPGGIAFDVQAAASLYNSLFGEVGDLLEGKKLLMVLSGALTSLPPQVLLKEEPEKNVSLNEMRWLGKENEIALLPSVASLKILRKTVQPSQAKQAFLGIGNPLLVGPDGQDRSAYEKQSCDISNGKKLSDLGKRSILVQVDEVLDGGQVNLKLLKGQVPLPETADELCAVADMLGVGSEVIRLGSEATEAKVKGASKDGSLKDARIIHFATHGLVAGETEKLVTDGAEPALVLTPPVKATRADDGLLMASEIAQLKLDAEWVILSACNTAAGSKPGAEPLSGLAKAFFYAGARALMVSHWAVDSDATVKLITESLKEHRDDPEISPAGALRFGIEKLIASREYAHPAYWAAFVVVGEGSRGG